MKEKTKNFFKDKKNIIWETVGYITLALCIFGQIAVGSIYLVAQCAYLIANVAGVIRDYALNLPSANKVKDIFFTAITMGLIIVRIVAMARGVA